MKKFWKWIDREIQNKEDGTVETERVLVLNGEIASESWFGDEVTYDGHYHNSWLSSHFPENLLRGGRNDD